MTNVCKIDLNDNIKYELTNIQEIGEEFEYPEIRLSFKVYMDKIVDEEFDDMLQQLLEERRERKRKREKDMEM